MNTKKFKILVTGSSGQLGMAIKELSPDFGDLDFVFASRQDLDITNQEIVTNYLEYHKPDAIINTAAYTAVDKAEKNKEAAYLINEKGVASLATACKEHNVKLIHISTDYVFDGKGSVPYQETDEVNPQSVYGQSKLAGEHILQKIAPTQFYIIRTSWLYSKKGHNFYNTMLRLAKEGKEISVVNDQWGSPTRASELAKALITIAVQGNSQNSGVYHYSGEGECTWYAFAKAILEKYYPHNYSIKPVGSYEYPTPARRPGYSVLNTSLIKKTFGIQINDWKSDI